MKNYKALKGNEKKLLIERIIQECRQIAEKYVREWEPINPEWPTVEGCAYLRLSTDQQVAVEKGSLEQQIYIAINEAESRSQSEKINYRIKHFFIEPGLTGRNDNRPEFNQMRSTIKRQIHKFVIFKEIARIARDASIWKDFFKLCIQNQCEVFIRGLPINPNDPTSLLQLDILAAFAEYESNQNSKRTRESNFSAMVNSGKFNSTHLEQVVNGEPKVGFYVANKQELETVEWIMRTFLKYGSQQKTIEECQRRGVKNKNGKEFKKHSLTTLLTNRKYVGKWEVNVENRNQPQHKLQQYARYAEVELPHGCVIDIALWNSVQKTLAELAGKNRKNTRLTRTYLLSGLMKFKDGSPFHGRSAYSSKGERNNYYYNKNLAQPFHAEDIEKEAKRIVAGIIRENDDVQDAVRKRFKEVKSLADLVRDQAEKLKLEIVGLENDKKALDTRIDFLLADGDIENAKVFRAEYQKKMAAINQQIGERRTAIELLEIKSKELGDDSFDWKGVKGRAEEIIDLIQENDPVALKRAYGQLFETVIVDQIDRDGKVQVKFVLREDSDGPKTQKPGVNLVENSCVSMKMAQARPHNTGEFPPPKPVVISSISTIPLVKQESFLRQKYEVEKLSIRQIAALTFSARSTVAAQMKAFGIPLRNCAQQLQFNKGQIAYGERHTQTGLIEHKGQGDAIGLMVRLRSKDYSYWKIAEELTRRGIPTKNGKGVWKAATVMKICKRTAKYSYTNKDSAS